jgi:hypothetical protein
MLFIHYRPPFLGCVLGGGGEGVGGGEVVTDRSSCLV